MNLKHVKFILLFMAKKIILVAHRYFFRPEFLNLEQLLLTIAESSINCHYRTEKSQQVVKHCLMRMF